MLLGRERELELLANSLEEALAGKPRVVILEGEPGLGKTTLVEHFLSTHLGETGHLLAQARCHDVGMQAEPFQPIMRAVGECVQHADANDPMIQKILTSRSFNTIAEVTAILPWLNYASAGMKLAQIYFKKEPDKPTPGEGNTSKALMDFVIESAETLPVILFLDDLHWADAHTLQWFADLLGACGEETRLLVLATSRQLEGGRNKALQGILQRLERDGATRDGQLTIARLSGLPEATARALIQRTLDGYPIGPPRFTEWLCAYSGGNPLVIVDTLHALQDDAFFALEEGRLVFVDPPRQVDREWILGSRLSVWLEGDRDATQRAITASLKTLDEGSRRVLDFAGVMAPVVYSRILSEVLGEDEIEIMRALDYLVEVGFLREAQHIDSALLDPSAMFEFITIAHRDAVRYELGEHTQRLMHARIREVLVRHLLDARAHLFTAREQAERLGGEDQRVRARITHRVQRIQRAIESLQSMLFEHASASGEGFLAAKTLHDRASEWCAEHAHTIELKGVGGSLTSARLLAMTTRVRELIEGLEYGFDEHALEEILHLEGESALLHARAWNGLDRHDLAREALEVAYTRARWLDDVDLLYRALLALAQQLGQDDARRQRGVRGRIIEHLHALEPAQIEALLDDTTRSHLPLTMAWLDEVQGALREHANRRVLEPILEEHIEGVALMDALSAIRRITPGEQGAFCEWVQERARGEDRHVFLEALARTLGAYREALEARREREILHDVDTLAFELCATIERVALLKKLGACIGEPLGAGESPYLRDDAHVQVFAMLIEEHRYVEECWRESEEVLSERAGFVDDVDYLREQSRAARQLLSRGLTTTLLIGRFWALLDVQLGHDHAIRDAELIWSLGEYFIERAELDERARARLLALMKRNPILPREEHMCDIAWHAASGQPCHDRARLAELEELHQNHWPHLSPRFREVVARRFAKAWREVDEVKQAAWLETLLEVSRHDEEGRGEEGAILRQLRDVATRAGDLSAYDVFDALGVEEEQDASKKLTRGIWLLQEAIDAWLSEDEPAALEHLASAYEAFSTPVGVGLIDDLCDHVIQIHKDIILELEDDASVSDAQLGHHIEQVITAYERSIRVCQQTEQWARVFEEYLELFDFAGEHRRFEVLRASFAAAVEVANALESTRWLGRLIEWVHAQQDAYVDNQREIFLVPIESLAAMASAHHRACKPLLARLGEPELFRTKRAARE